MPARTDRKRLRQSCSVLGATSNASRRLALVLAAQRPQSYALSPASTSVAVYLFQKP